MTLACIVIEKRNLPMPATIANIFTKKTRTQSSAISCYIELYWLKDRYELGRFEIFEMTLDILKLNNTQIAKILQDHLEKSFV